MTTPEGPATKAMTLRLPADLSDQLALIAECDGETMSEAIRAAVAAWIERRRADPLVQDALRRRIDLASHLLPGRTDQ